jgi:hypothetical protein
LVELDFSSIHTRIAYEICGKVPPLDCYEIGDGYQRPLVKALMLLIHNWKRSALQGFHGTLRVCMGREYEKRKRMNKTAQMFSEPLADIVKYDPDQFSNWDINRTIERIKEFHAPIEKFLFADAGRMLQNYDSQIAAEVILSMPDIPLFVIHDGYLTTAENVDRLKQAMTWAYQKVLGTNNIPGIK